MLPTTTERASRKQGKLLMYFNIPMIQLPANYDHFCGEALIKQWATVNVGLKYLYIQILVLNNRTLFKLKSKAFKYPCLCHSFIASCTFVLWIRKFVLCSPGVHLYWKLRKYRVQEASKHVMQGDNDLSKY